MPVSPQYALQILFWFERGKMGSPYRPYGSPFSTHRSIRPNPQLQGDGNSERGHDSSSVGHSMMLLESEYNYANSPSLYPPVHSMPSPSIRSVAMPSPAFSRRYVPGHDELPYRSNMPTPCITRAQKPTSTLSNVVPVSFSPSCIFPKSFLPRYCTGLKRQRTVREIELVQGNLVLDCPVPSSLVESSARKDFEFSHMRYSAVTCDPDSFSDCQFTLRPRLQGRETELFICMTMYNVRIF